MTAGDIKIRTGELGDSFSGVVCNGVDDYMAIAALGAQQAGAADVVGTISGWINIPNITGSYCMFSLGDTNADEYLQLSIVAGKLSAACTDGAAAQWATASTNVVITPHKWHHIALVHTGGATVGRPFLYVDGVRVAHTDTVTTDLTEWTNGLTGLDNASIGILSQNTSTTLDFLGAISYVKYATGIAASGADWTSTQVKQEYDYRAGKGSGSGVTTGVLCTWTLNNSLVESTTGGGTYDLTATSDAQFDLEYSNMTSKLRLLAPVVADDISIVPHGMNGAFTAVVIKAA